MSVLLSWRLLGYMRAGWMLKDDDGCFLRAKVIARAAAAELKGTAVLSVCSGDNK